MGRNTSTCTASCSESFDYSPGQTLERFSKRQEGATTSPPVPGHNSIGTLERHLTMRYYRRMESCNGTTSFRFPHPHSLHGQRSNSCSPWESLRQSPMISL